MKGCSTSEYRYLPTAQRPRFPGAKAGMVLIEDITNPPDATS
jgi:hypothetical protein